MIRRAALFPPFPEEKAAKVLEKLMQALTEGRISLEQVARPSEERKNPPIMLGALVCTDKNGNEVNLVTNSGNARKLKIEAHKGAIRVHPRSSASDFTLVPSIVSPEEIESALAENDEKIHELTRKLKNEAHKGAIRGYPRSSASNELKQLCAASLEKVHALYQFHCIDGKVHSLKEICAAYNRGKLPPTGTGDCCAPKLLDYAFSHDLHPISLAEMVLEKQSVRDCSPEVAGRKADGNERERRAESPTDARSESEVATGTPKQKTENGKMNDENFEAGKTSPLKNDFSHEKPNYSLFTNHYSLTSPCTERCGILLPAMLGLRILYRDEAICVVNKESGVLSVPGRGEDKQDCVESRFRRLFGEKVEIAQPAVHRLDMETSGVLILAFTKEAHRELNRQFEAKSVEKEYVALLDGVLPKKGIAPHGKMELFFRLDVENRPHQIWDAENGKSAVTEWHILGVERYHAPDGTVRPATRVLFLPHTGRTHQLRLASADGHGFGTPIIGDTLYGKCEKGERLCLHATKVTFTHPVTGERMTVESECEF